MKIVKIVAFAAFALLAVSCKKDKNIDPIISTPMETEGLVKVIDFNNQTHTIELFTKSGDFKVGHNALFVRVKNTASQTYESALTMAVKPMMHMTSMSHACPVSAYSKTANKTNLYDGYLVFQMASNATEYWDLTIDYTINGVDYTATNQVTVNNAAKRRVTTFTGTDSKKYILAMVEPASPKVGINEMQAMLFKMESMTNYPAVNGYQVLIDPRMPSMGNHGSPNNVDLVQANNTGIYNGKLSLTMTGYWKVNLQVMNAEQEILKGEEVTTAVEASSIFFELEF
jgi:hypothetical protein